MTAAPIIINPAIVPFQVCEKSAFLMCLKGWGLWTRFTSVSSFGLKYYRKYQKLWDWFYRGQVDKIRKNYESEEINDIDKIDEIGWRVTARQDNCPSDICPSDICPSDICPPDICPPDNCPPDIKLTQFVKIQFLGGQLSDGQLSGGQSFSGQLSGGQLSGGQLFSGKLSGGYLSGG